MLDLKPIFTVLLIDFQLLLQIQKKTLMSRRKNVVILLFLAGRRHNYKKR